MAKKKRARRTAKRKKKAESYVRLVGFGIVAIFLGLAVVASTLNLPVMIDTVDGKKELPPQPHLDGFCGFSTFGECVTDGDCMQSGCSLQICQTQSEELVVTSCEWKDCYDNEKYAVNCGCVDGMCQWAK